MKTRIVKQYSDRGSIKNLSQLQEKEMPYSSYELRVKKICDFAYQNNDKNLLSSFGFITTDYIEDKNALPLTVYRLRKIVQELQNNNIFNIKQQLDNCFVKEKFSETELNIIAKANFNKTRSIIKIGSAPTSGAKCSFWKAN